MAIRRRLDSELIRRKLVTSVEEAHELITARRVIAGGVVADNPARMVTPAEAVSVKAAPSRFVSRGGEKLAAALHTFNHDVTGQRVIDVGSSTGGFTDCVLQHGAREVLAIDVGTNQLNHRLRQDPRVTVWEQTDIRDVDPATVERADLIVADLSFISLKPIFASFRALVRPNGRCITLIKPQFEVTHNEATQARGVIRDPELWRRTIREALAVAEQEHLQCRHITPSPITGTSGNVEFLIMLVPMGESCEQLNQDQQPWAEMVDRAVDQAIAQFGTDREEQ